MSPKAVVMRSWPVLPLLCLGSWSCSSQDLLPQKAFLGLGIVTWGNVDFCVELVPSLTWASWESWPHHSPTAAFGRWSLAPPWATVELTLVVGAQVSLPEGHEHGSDGLTTCLTCSGTGKRYPQRYYHLWQTGEVALRS